jgi:predicted amidophosphoribosyltransferase
MKKELICFECGKRYLQGITNFCPRCGETQTFNPSLHSQDYDITKDPAALLKLRLYGIAGLLLLLITVMNLTH